MADVYGEQILDDALDKLYAALDSFKTATTANDPKISYAYRNHATADLRLNAATVQLDTADSVTRGASSKSLVDWTMEFSIRVHTAYTGGQRDARKVTRLLNSITNYLKERFNLGDGFRIEHVGSIEIDQDYEDSATYGGELTATISGCAEYTQV